MVNFTNYVERNNRIRYETDLIAKISEMIIPSAGRGWRGN
jgi:hypothetical protein